MKIIISGSHLQRFPEIEKYALKKVKKLAKYNGKIETLSIRLISTKSHREKEQDYTCEIQANIPGKNLGILDVEESMDKAIDKATERMKRLLIKAKEKKISKLHKMGLKQKAQE